jgi:hypothetical protein
MWSLHGQVDMGDEERRDESLKMMHNGAVPRWRTQADATTRHFGLSTQVNR